MRYLLLLGLIACGCSPEIGDDCLNDSECGSGRICDRASKGGYCTVTPCVEDGCPGGSICVVFENDLEYCMAKCTKSSDCRGGYYCDKETASKPFCREKP